MKSMQTARRAIAAAQRTILAAMLAGSMIAGFSGASLATHDSSPPATPDQADFVGGLFVEALGDDVYFVTDGAYQSMFQVHANGVILVDAPPFLFDTGNAPGGRTLLDVIAEVTDGKPITHLIYSHYHADHIGMAGVVAEANPGIRIIAHEDTAKRLAERHAISASKGTTDQRPLPDRTFKKTTSVVAGGKRMILSHTSVYHVPGDTRIFAPKARVVMAVDHIFPGWVPFANYALSTNTSNYVAAHDELLALDFDVLIGGHVIRLGDRSDVEIQKEYFQAVVGAAGFALFSVPFTFIEGDTLWTAFRRFVDEVSDHCAANILAQAATGVPSWSNLVSLEAFTDTHCFTAQEQIRIEDAEPF